MIANKLQRPLCENKRFHTSVDRSQLSNFSASSTVFLLNSSFVSRFHFSIVSVKF